MDYLGDPDGNLRKMKRAPFFRLPPPALVDLRVERLLSSRTLGGSVSPSDTIKSATAVKAAVTNPDGPRYGRPSDRFGPPTVLFNKALARLKYELDNPEKLVPRTACTRGAHDLIITATNFFGDEDQGRDALEHIINTLVGEEGNFPGEVGKEAKPDDLWVEGPFGLRTEE
jgi:hypothetical protein